MNEALISEGCNRLIDPIGAPFWEDSMNRLLCGAAFGAILLGLGGGAQAADLPGKFDGVTIDAKLIGGQQYEKLYERIGEWEKLTGGKVNVISKKNHFELDKEI